MGLDIRLPLGYVFVIVGLIMTAYGVATWHSPIYAVSMGVNINLVWGLTMLLSGGVTLIVAKRR